MSNYGYTVNLLHQNGLRATVPRQWVLAWLVDHPHATAEQVYYGTCEQLGSISKQAVYDVLADCMNVQLVRQIKPSGHPARFERRTGDNHHHMVCRGCGLIHDVDCVRGAKPCLTPDHDHDFTIDEAEVVFWGLCPTCVQSA